MLLCPTSRRKLLRFLPQGGEVAEIGVAEGEFSQEILNATAPDLLHLVDPWEHQARDDYRDDPNNASRATQDARYEAVAARFADETRRGRVKIHRAYSQDAADEFEPEQLDWIYVDAMHTFAAVYRDLVAYHEAVKRDGFIVGHDYTNHEGARGWNFGVVEAVNRFVADFGYEFVALTLEKFPTYVLAKDPGSKAATDLATRLISELPFVVELRGYPKNHAFEHKTLHQGDTIFVYPSF